MSNPIGSPSDPGPRSRWIVPILVPLTLLAGCSDPAATTSAGAGGSTSAVEERSRSEDPQGAELFDASVVHSISVEFDQTDYDAMIATFQESDEKEWIEATVTIDGTTYERAGLRLKGNSSLMGLRGGAGRAGGGAPGGMGGGADADTPERLPWLIRLDEFVADQRHEGYADIVVRSNNTTTSLNEAVALELLDSTTLASQLSMATSFSVNDSEAILRLAVENPDDDAWQDRAFGTEGALYKAESTGDWSYRGDDPESYTDVFDQEGGKNVADLTPLISFLQFVNQSDDATFAAELGERLDVEAFATYLAMMDLLENFDDIDGPGNNAYLWWDAETEQFTVVPWDMNLAFGQMGGGPGGARGGPPEGFDPSQMPDGLQPPEGFDPSQMPDGMQPPEGADADGGRGGMFGRENVLVQRFHADADFEAIYQEQLEYLRSELFGSDAATTVLDEWVATLRDGTDLVDDDTLDQEAAALRERLTSIANAG